ncbi:hypothetical protein BGX28_008094 [Mortierella sp. GBA30]|nr:hypothetical protein BGX28_008094 [Mortierella sp. GBA30]
MLALAAVKNKAIDQVIDQVISGFKSTDEDPVCPVFVLGDGEFGKDAGYQAFISLLKKKVQELRLLIACCDKWRTLITRCQWGDNGGEEQERLLPPPAICNEIETTMRSTAWVRRLSTRRYS